MSSQYAGDDLFPTDYAIPDDSDPRDAASVNVAFEALGDRTIYLHARVDDAWRIIYDETAAAGDIDAVGQYQTSITNTTAWTPLIDGSVPMLIVLPSVKAGDRINVQCSGNGEIISPAEVPGAVAALIRGRIVCGEDDVSIPGVGVEIDKAGYSVGLSQSFAFAACGTYVAASDEESVAVSLQAKLTVASEDIYLQVWEPLCLRVQVLRQNHPAGPS